ncbi:serine/threonine protein kinase [Coemansia sp. RSA 2049]|nr:serine/threonine protein kinase [Coemansia sp. RSA 2049]KAJ2608114.1 serine/threonine protein kinase [Coemansia sp. RSA 1804]
MTAVANASRMRHLNIPTEPVLPSPPTSGTVKGSAADTTDKSNFTARPALAFYIPSNPSEQSLTQQNGSSQPWALAPTLFSSRPTLGNTASYTCCAGTAPSSPSLTQYVPTAVSDTGRSTTIGPYRRGARCGSRSSNAYGVNAVDGTLSLTVRPAGWTLKTFGPSIRRLGAGTGGCVDLHRATATSKTLQSKLKGATDTQEPASGSRLLENGNTRALGRRVLEELGIAVNMRHRNIVSTHDVIVETDRTCYVVMEACTVDLLTLIQGRHQNQPNGHMLPNDKRAMDGYFVQLVQGVHYLHGIGVGHRDLKLDNICVTDQGVLKIVDFGCATLFRRRIQQHSASRSSLGHGVGGRQHTRTRTTPYNVSPFQQTQPARGSGNQEDHQYVETLSYGICGSDPYMAPELFDNGYYMAPRADIWALGIIYFAMQHQQFPWAVAQTARDTRYGAFEKSPDLFVATWFSETPIDSGNEAVGRGDYESLGNWSLVPSLPGVNFLNMTQKKCHSDDTPRVNHHHQPTAAALDATSMPTTTMMAGEYSSVRRFVRRMLDTNPTTRADINEIVSDPWFVSLLPSSA